MVMFSLDDVLNTSVKHERDLEVRELVEQRWCAQRAAHALPR